MRDKFILINFCLKTIINQKQGMCHFMVSCSTYCEFREIHSPIAGQKLRQILLERANYFSHKQRLAYVNVNPVLASPTQRQQKQCVGEGWGCFLLSHWKILCSLEELLIVLSFLISSSSWTEEKSNPPFGVQSWELLFLPLSRPFHSLQQLWDLW